MNTKMGAVLALVALGGALYGTLATKTAAQAEAQAEPRQSAPLTKKNAPALKVKPNWNGLNAPPPPLTTLELKALPPGAIPLEFNGSTVYWIPLDEQISAKTKTSSRPAS